MGPGEDRSPTPEESARANIDELLVRGGWVLQNPRDANPRAARGVAVREVVLNDPHGRVDYLLFVDGAPVGALEAKPEKKSLVGVDWQNKKYSEGVPDALGPPIHPLPFLYESTGKVTYFTNTLDPKPRARQVFAFHRPETLAGWLVERTDEPNAPTLRARLQRMPEVDATDLWPPKDEAVRNLEASLSANRPRALIQMSTGAGKTKLAAFISYRLVKFAKAQRILFLVDRANLGRQTQKEFQQFVVPDDQRKFTELYNVQRLASPRIDTTAKVCISTIQRLYSILRGEELAPEADEHSPYDPDAPAPALAPIEYNPDVPIETFDFIVVDECHRSIYGLWRQVLDYFDSFVVGLTATPSAQTFGYFEQNIVMEYPYERAVADGINVDFDVYRIRTEIGEKGATVPPGFVLGYRNRATRVVRWETEDEPLTYTKQQLDQAVVAEDQLRTVITTFKEKLFTDLFPGRTNVPKTLIFAKNDSHADDIVQMVREVFDEGSDFCRKITYQVTGNIDDLISAFRNEYYPRIAVTVDMIATGTDVKPLECLMFMRMVRSRTYFEQMRGRAVRVIDADDLRVVTPDATAKTRFVLVDAVGVTETELLDHQPLERKPSMTFEELLNAIVSGDRDPDLISSLASRLTRLDRQIAKTDREELEDIANCELVVLVRELTEALDPDAQREETRRETGKSDPTDAEVATVAARFIEDAVQLIATNERFREKLLEVRRSYEQTIDETSKDVLVEAHYSKDATDRAKATVQSFRQFIEEHKDEIAALQVMYGAPYKERLTLYAIRELANAIERPPHRWTPEVLWDAYERLDKSKVRGSGKRVLTDLVSVIRYTLEQEHELVAYPDRVNERFTAWLEQEAQAGTTFSDEQRWWLERMRDHIATSLGIVVEDFELTPFVEHGGLGKAYEVFGASLEEVLHELNRALAA